MAPSPTLEEREVIEAFVSAPAEDSFQDLFRAISPQLFGYFRVRRCSTSTAEDLTQEVMLTVYTQYAQLRDRELFRPWLFRIARNAWLQYLRLQTRQVPASGIESAAGVHDPSPDAFRDSCFSEWMAWLAPDERELILLRYVEGLEYHEIAAMLGMPQGTVQWKLFRTRRRLAERFGHAG